MKFFYLIVADKKVPNFITKYFLEKNTEYIHILFVVDKDYEYNLYMYLFRKRIICTIILKKGEFFFKY